MKICRDYSKEIKTERLYRVLTCLPKMHKLKNILSRSQLVILGKSFMQNTQLMPVNTHHLVREDHKILKFKATVINHNKQIEAKWT